MKKLLQFSLVLLATVSIAAPLASGRVSAGTLDDDARSSCVDNEEVKCIKRPTDPALREDCRSDGDECNPVAKYVNPFINTLAALAGLAVAIGIIVGGIQYASSGGDPQKAAAGKQHIKTAVVALIGFLFMWSFLQFLIPGGVFAP